MTRRARLRLILLGASVGLLCTACKSQPRYRAAHSAAGIRDPWAARSIAPLPELPSELPASPLQDEPAPSPVQAELVPTPAPDEPHNPSDTPSGHPASSTPILRVDTPQSSTSFSQEPESLTLNAVVDSVERYFPLLIAAEMEQSIAAGRRLAFEGAFDVQLRSEGTHQNGTFASNRFNIAAEQAVPWNGVSVFGGYRFGFGDYPVYYGNRLTADGGELRAGVLLPLLRDRPIDQRRALWRQAQLGEPLAAATVQRLRLDFYRLAAHRYWNWVAAGAQHAVAERLLNIARDRQTGLAIQFAEGQIAEFNVVDNLRMIAERQGILVAAERRLQQAAFELSLYLRDDAGNPIVPAGERLPRDFIHSEPAEPAVDRIQGSVAMALDLRPELVQFQILKEQKAIDLQLFDNQTLPALNAAVSGSNDVGMGKQAEGMFALDRTVAEASLMMDVPLQRRDARGKMAAARAAMRQLLNEERFARDQIVVEVQDAISDLILTHTRLARAREEQSVAQRVAELEVDRFEKGQGTLLEVNLRELAAADAQRKVIDALADFFRAEANYQQAVGLPAQP